jgi:hypothetical protein
MAAIREDITNKRQTVEMFQLCRRIRSPMDGALHPMFLGSPHKRQGDGDGWGMWHALGIREICAEF